MLLTISWITLATSLLPVTGFAGSSIPFGLAIIAHGLVFTCLNAWKRGPTISHGDARLLVAGIMLHTVTMLTFASARGHGIMVSCMAFACLLYEVDNASFTLEKGVTYEPKIEAERWPMPLRIAWMALCVILIPFGIFLMAGILFLCLALVLIPLAQS